MGFSMSRKPTHVAGLNLQYYMEYSSEIDYPCHSNPEICYNDYCRCSVINNVVIHPTNDVVALVDYIAREAYGKPKSIITQYCINRILYHYKVFDVDTMYWESCPGYYGEELRRIYLLKAGAIDKEVLSIMTWPEALQIEYVLEMEYGKVLDELVDLTWTVETVKFEDLHFGQQDHLKNLNPEIIKSYESYQLPRGICIPMDDKYRVIDGYHRCSATPVKGKKSRVLDVLVGKRLQS